MNKPVDSIVRPTRAFQAAGCLLMVVAGLVHFRYCDWDLSFLGKSSEPEVLEVRYIAGPIYPDESFPGNVWDAGILGVMLPGSLVMVGLFLLALADNHQAGPLRHVEEFRRTSVPLASFGQVGSSYCGSTLRISPATATRPLATRRIEPKLVPTTDALDRKSQQYAVCPLCHCFSIVPRPSPAKLLRCPFCGRPFAIEDLPCSCRSM